MLSLHAVEWSGQSSSFTHPPHTAAVRVLPVGHAPMPMDWAHSVSQALAQLEALQSSTGVDPV